MSREVQVRFCESRAVRSRPATHLIAACHSQGQAEQVKAQLAEWLAIRGLALNEDKTSITHAHRGFDFLGFNIRRYPNDKLLIKPSKAVIKRIRKRLREVFRKMQGATTLTLIPTLNPIMSKWAATTGRRCPAARSSYWTTTCGNSRSNGPRAATATNRRSGSPTATSAGSTLTGRTDGCSATATAASTSSSSPGPGSSGTSWSPGGSSPEDPALTAYWANRRRKHKPPLGG
jgi:RNA-directed DNA polymerase